MSVPTVTSDAIVLIGLDHTLRPSLADPVTLAPVAAGSTVVITLAWGLLASVPPDALAKDAAALARVVAPAASVTVRGAEPDRARFIAALLAAQPAS